jgi:hypothetical protein
MQAQIKKIWGVRFVAVCRFLVLLTFVAAF